MRWKEIEWNWKIIRNTELFPKSWYDNPFKSYLSFYMVLLMMMFESEKKIYLMNAFYINNKQNVISSIAF